MNPLEAANIVLSIFQALYRAGEGQETPAGNGETRSDAESAARDLFERDYFATQQRIDRLVLVVHAMWSLMSEKMGVTDADLLKRMTDLDAADGTTDGRVTPAPVRCSCGAMVCQKLNRCLFCGKQYEAGSAFDTL